MVLLYNSDQVKEAPKSWKALADKAYQGKVVIPGMPDIQGLSLVMVLDKAAGGNASEPGDIGIGPGKSSLFFLTTRRPWNRIIRR